MMNKKIKKMLKWLPSYLYFNSREIRAVYNIVIRTYGKYCSMDLSDSIFKRKFGRSIDWDNPKDLNEKINWLKFHADPYEWATLADKYKVREYVKKCELEKILVPLYGKWDTAEDLLSDWERLPDEFVLKSNNGCGNIIIVDSKNGGKKAVDKAELKRKLDHWLKTTNYGIRDAELHYQFIENCIIAEKILKDNSTAVFSCSLIDYKIWCFDGKPYGCLVVYDRHIGGNYKYDWYDLEWREHPELMLGDVKRHPIPKPKNWKQMLEIAAALSNGLPQVRVDLYNIDGDIYFGELTLTAHGGYMTHYSQKLLLEMGKQVQLDLNMKGNGFFHRRRRVGRQRDY